MRRTILAACALVLTAACTSGNPSGSGSPTSSGSACTRRISTPATLAFISPSVGASVPRGHVEVKLKLTGAKVVPPGTSCDVKPDEGHVHILLDGRTITIAAGLDIVVNDIEIAPGKKLGPLSAGTHVLDAKFVDSAHIPFSPEVNTPPLTFRAT